eukprot:155073-Rhodomonas_salina.1
MDFGGGGHARGYHIASAQPHRVNRHQTISNRKRWIATRHKALSIRKALHSYGYRNQQTPSNREHQ